MIDPVTTSPVYARVLKYAYDTPHDWDSVNVGTRGPRAWAEDVLPRIDLGPASGKTTTIIEFAQHFHDVIMLVPSVDQANNITRRHNGVRAFSMLHLDRMDRTHFRSTDPLFVFDATLDIDTLDILNKFRPRRFVHLGAW